MAETTRWGPKAVTALWVLTLASAPTAPAQESCTPETMTAWLELRRESLGVRGTDPHPILAPEVVPDRDQPLEVSCPTEVDFALDQEGRAVDGIHSWVFAHPCKLTVCGTPLSFEENRRFFWISGEYDLNNNIEFDDAFRMNRLNRHLCIPPSADTGEPRLALQEPRLCFPGTKTLHVEITPPEDLRPLMHRLWLDDPPEGWFRWRRSLYHEQVCVYGPFVADTAHAALAEIHPAQLYWWNERPDPASGKRSPFDADGPFALFLIQDGSNRYTQPHHFVLENAPPENSDWRPWAYGPLEAVYDVAFWSPRDEPPPQFELSPYEYGGETSPSPVPVSCEGDRVQELIAGDGTVYARVCNGTGRKRGTGADVESQWLCECKPGEKPAEWKGEWCPEAGFLGKLTLRMSAGGSREWREGFLAVRLTDSRSLGSRPTVATITELARPKVKTDETTEQLTWKPAWEPVDPPGLGDSGAAEARQQMFDSAGWPDTVMRPESSLWRLRTVELTADVAVPQLRDKDRKEKKVTASFHKAQATALAGSDTRILAFDHVEETAARLSLVELPRTEVFRIDVSVEMTVRHPQISTEQVVSQAEQRQDMTDETRAVHVWFLWSHGLGAEPENEWHRGARALCDHHRKKPAPEEQPPPSGAPEEPPAPPGTGTLDVDLRTVVDRVLKDEVVSMTQLTLLVRDVERLCRSGVELQPAARPTPVQAKE